MVTSPHTNDFTVERQLTAEITFILSQSGPRVIVSGQYARVESDPDFAGRVEKALEVKKAFPAQARVPHAQPFPTYLKELREAETALAGAVGDCLFSGVNGAYFERLIIDWMKVARDNDGFVRVLIAMDPDLPSLRAIPWEMACLEVDEPSLATQNVGDRFFVCLGTSRHLTLTRLRPTKATLPRFNNYTKRKIPKILQIVSDGGQGFDGSTFEEAHRQGRALLARLVADQVGMQGSSVLASELTVPSEGPDILQIVGHSDNDRFFIPHIGAPSPLFGAYLDALQLTRLVGRPRSLAVLMACGGRLDGAEAKEDLGEALGAIVPTTLSYGALLPSGQATRISGIFMLNLIHSGWIDVAAQFTRSVLEDLRGRMPRTELEHVYGWRLRLETQDAYSLDYFRDAGALLNHEYMNDLAGRIITGSLGHPGVVLEGRDRRPARAGKLRAFSVESPLELESFKRIEETIAPISGDDAAAFPSVHVESACTGCGGYQLASITVDDYDASGGAIKQVKLPLKSGGSSWFSIDSSDCCETGKNSYELIAPARFVGTTVNQLWWDERLASANDIKIDGGGNSHKVPVDDGSPLQAFEAYSGPLCRLLEKSIVAIVKAGLSNEEVSASIDAYMGFDWPGGFVKLEALFTSTDPRVTELLEFLGNEVRLSETTSVSWTRRTRPDAFGRALEDGALKLKPMQVVALLAHVHSLMMAIGVAREARRSGNVDAYVDYYGSEWFPALVKMVEDLS